METMVTVSANSPQTVRIFDKVAYAYPAPEELKIGFAASTGGQTNFHEIRNLIVQVSDEENLLKPEGVDIEGLVACEGQDNIFEIPMESISLPNENSRLNCIRFFETYEKAEDETGEICEKSNCGEVGKMLSFPEGVFSVTDKEGAFTFTPNDGFQGEDVSTYYTLTDNFGKTSEPKLLTVTIREAPVTLTLFADGIPSEEIFLCPGADTALEAYSEEGFEFYEWYKEEVLMTGTDDGKTVAWEAGEYFVKAFNENGCPVYSNTVAVAFPDFPQLVIEGPVTVCNPGLFPDIRDFIEEYNEEQFDYGIETPEGDFLVNEDMDIQSGGLYHIRVKPRVLDCWSDAVAFEVSVPETELEASVDYHLNGTGMKEQSDEGILTDDEVYFVDTSTGDIVSWEWDFGDGKTSNLKSPVHVYGQKGDFRVFLTVKNREGCVSTSNIDIAIKRSYRIMFPNGFTPTREEDRYFRPKVKGIVKMELMVFSAWGELLFKSDDLEMEGWDGTLNGKDLPPGRYVYRADFESRDGESITRSGKVLLIR
jgi:gliding motility-associated-like protein